MPTKEPMTDEHRAEIRARLDAQTRDGWDADAQDDFEEHCAQDIDDLLAEVDRLRRDVAMLETYAAYLRSQVDVVSH